MALGGRQSSDPTGRLIGKVACGDVDAFACLYDDVAPLIYGVARRVVRDGTLAEEVTQDVLLTVWQQASRYDPRCASGRTWVLVIAHRRAVDRVRCEQASRNRNDRCGRESTVPPFDDVLDIVEERVEHTAVAAALRELTNLQRQALTLAYFGGHSYREVAQLLDVPLGTAKTRIRDGLISLRNALEATNTIAPSGWRPQASHQ